MDGSHLCFFHALFSGTRTEGKSVLLFSVDPSLRTHQKKNRKEIAGKKRENEQHKEDKLFLNY